MDNGIANLTGGQPFSPPVAATHQNGIRMFRIGRDASAELEAIAEDGDPTPMFDLFNGSEKVTDAVSVGVPLAHMDPFMPSVSFMIESRYDRFSLATMLICTNDGFTGLDSVRMPRRGSKVFLLNGYDAGTEDNTEASIDIVDACSALGPEPLDGDPNGNANAPVDTMPHEATAHHPNIMGGGDLPQGGDQRRGGRDLAAQSVFDLLQTIVGLGNEDFGVGFFTKYGDGGVDLSPIADLLKSEIQSDFFDDVCGNHDLINPD